MNVIGTEIAFTWEPVAELLKEANLRDLIAEYWEELSPHKERLQLAVDYEKMMAWEQVGIYRVWTARAEGVLAGFIGFQIVPHLNYRHTLFAFDMGHYLSPAYRGKGWAGIKMWATACEALKTLGVKVVIAHDNSVRPLDSFFGRLGFEPRSTLFWKAL